MFIPFFVVLPCSSKEHIPDMLPYMKSKWFYSNPQHSRTKYYNEVLPGIYNAARPHMDETSFEAYLFRERAKRWETKTQIDKFEKEVNYLLSDNPACFGKYMRLLTYATPQDLNNCKRAIKQLSDLEYKVKSHMLKTKNDYQAIFDDRGLQCKSWAQEQKDYQ